MNDYVIKLETKNYYIGSFDKYSNESKNLLSDDEKNIIDELPYAYRASIIDKNRNYIGFIGLKDIDWENQHANYYIKTVNDKIDQKEIIDEFINYCKKSLNIQNFNNDTNNNDNRNKEYEPNFFTFGIDDEILNEYIKNGNNIPNNINIPVTLFFNENEIGIAYLTNIGWANRRATLNIHLNRDIKLSPKIINKSIDEYLNYLHTNKKLININLSINQNDRYLNNLITRNKKINFYGEKKYSSLTGEKIYHTNMYQSLPDDRKMKIIRKRIPRKIFIPHTKLSYIRKNNQKELFDQVILCGNYKMVKPSLIDERIFLNILNGYIHSIENREKFTIPLGDDKFFPQVGNEKYGLYKSLRNYNYVIIDDNNNFIGFINILRKDDKKINCEIEIGISPEYQQKGIGRLATTSFINQLFNIGYASVTTNIFDFNDKSNKLIKNFVNKTDGIRIDSYYTNGKYYNMRQNTIVNPKISKK